MNQNSSPGDTHSAQEDDQGHGNMSEALNCSVSDGLGKNFIKLNLFQRALGRHKVPGALHITAFLFERLAMQWALRFDNVH